MREDVGDLMIMYIAVVGSSRLLEIRKEPCLEMMKEEESGFIGMMVHTEEDRPLLVSSGLASTTTTITTTTVALAINNHDSEEKEYEKAHCPINLLINPTPSFLHPLPPPFHHYHYYYSLPHPTITATFVNRMTPSWSPSSAVRLRVATMPTSRPGQVNPAVTSILTRWWGGWS